MDSQTKLKRVVIKEELVLLTGDYIKALILNQFLYWSERTKDFDRFIQEEQNRFSVEDDDLNMELSYGWIYKSADELNEELMLDLSAVTIRRHLTKLIKAGYIEQRHNPKHKWDRTIQYRPNIIAIQIGLEAMGYSLEGYPLLTPPVKDASFTVKDGNFIMKDQSATNEGAIPETTTENTTEILSNSQKSSEIAQSNDDQQKQALNSLALRIATELCNIDIDTASEGARKALKKLTLALFLKDVSEGDIDRFRDWWGTHDWRGQKGQVPTPSQVGDVWGAFEAYRQNGNGKHKIVMDSDGGMYL